MQAGPAGPGRGRPGRAGAGRAGPESAGAGPAGTGRGRLGPGRGRPGNACVIVFYSKLGGIWCGKGEGEHYLKGLAFKKNVFGRVLGRDKI